MFCRKGALRNFAKLTGKHLCQSYFIKKESLVLVFQYEFCEISKNTCFYRTPPVAVSLVCQFLETTFRNCSENDKLKLHPKWYGGLHYKSKFRFGRITFCILFGMLVSKRRGNKAVGKSQGKSKSLFLYNILCNTTSCHEQKLSITSLSVLINNSHFPVYKTLHGQKNIKLWCCCTTTLRRYGQNVCWNLINHLLGTLFSGFIRSLLGYLERYLYVGKVVGRY